MYEDFARIVAIVRLVGQPTETRTLERRQRAFHSPQRLRPDAGFLKQPRLPIGFRFALIDYKQSAAGCQQCPSMFQESERHQKSSGQAPGSQRRFVEKR